MLQNNSFLNISEVNFFNLISNDFNTHQQYNALINNISTVDIGNISKKLVKSYREYCKIAASPDGNCLYNSISLLLSGTQNKMKILKLITAFTIIKHKNFFDSIVQSDLHVENCNFFIEEALKLGVWGRDIHIFALSIALKRSINVFNRIGKKNEDLVGGQSYCGVRDTQFEPLLLIYD